MGNSILLKLAKLKAMSADEVSHRINEKLFKKKEHANYILGKKPVIPVSNGLTLISANVSEKKFFTDLVSKEERRPLIEKYFSGESWVTEADRILNGKLILFGKEISLPREIDWNEDPVEKVSWPEMFYGGVGKNKPAGCDIKFIWEINRHQFLVPLAKAFYITGDEKYSERVMQIISSWIDQNPYNRGVNWTSSLEQAVRAFAWIWAVNLCKGSSMLTPGLQRKFVGSLYEHGLYISDHLSIYASPYNHLIGEVSALHLIGFMLNDIEECEKWEQRGWEILEQEIEKQFHEDGMTVEQASFYHHFTLGFYLHSAILRKKNGGAVSVKLLNRIERALEFSMYMTRPDGELPRIGDIDNARSLYFRQGHSWDFRGFLAIGAVMFNRPDFKAVAGKLSEELFWLSDSSDLERFDRIREEYPKETSKPFYQSGYFFSRDSWKSDSGLLVFDCGEMAHGLYPDDTASAAHGHADALSFELCVYGVPFIVEGGFNTYFGDLSWHKYFRHEEAHNTLRIGEEMQAAYSGRLTWNRVVNPVFTKWINSGEFDYMSGFIKYRNAVHKRDILVIKSAGWLVNDYIETDMSDTDITSFFHFHPDIEVKAGVSGNILSAFRGEAGICVNFPGDFVISMEKGGEAPDQGWVADGYGFKEPGWIAAVRFRTVNRRAHFPTLITKQKNGGDVIKSVDETDFTCSKVEFQVERKCYSVSFRDGRIEEVKKEGKLLFDAFHAVRGG